MPKVPQRIRNMLPETRERLARDIEQWGNLVGLPQLEIAARMRANNPDEVGVINRALRLKQWHSVFGLRSPVASDGYVPPDIAPGLPQEAPEPLGVTSGPRDEQTAPVEPQVAREQPDPNHLNINVRGQALIMNLEDLVRVSGLDLERWRVVRHETNTWTTSIKVSRQVGTDEKGNPVTVQEPVVVRNWQVKAWCERRFDTGLVIPTFSVVRSTPAPRPRRDGRKLALLVPDPQIGFRRYTGELFPLHDRRAMDLAVQMVALIRPDIIGLLGDNLDLAELSETYPCPADMVDTAGPALAEMRYWLARLKIAAPEETEILVLEGNHGDRLRRLRRKRLGGMADLTAPGDSRAALDLGRMIGVDDFGVQYVQPYGASAWLWDKVEITHGDVVRAKSGATVASVVEGLAHSQVFGHVHRVELAHRTQWGPGGPKTVFAATPGCLCRIVEGIVPGAKPKNNWQQGLGVVTFDIDAEQEGIVLPTISRGRMWWEGSRLEGSDPTAEIEKQTGWRFAKNWLLEGE